MEDEVFGPILPILPYKSLDEAFARVAATPRPLAGSSSAATRRPSIGSSASCPMAGAG